MSELEILDERRAPDRCARTARIPPTLGWVEGHFPGFPVVPGFVQLGWAIDTARVFTDGGALRRIDGLKFKEILRPGDVVDVMVERGPGGIRFAVEREGTVVSSGRLVFEGPSAP